MKSNEVYKITNKVNNKIYIGITNQGSGTRYRHHWYEARTGEPSPIHRAMAKYGEDNFTLEIIDFADSYNELKEKEKYYIKLYNSTDRTIGYNLTEGGDGTFGRKHSEETKEKIRQKAIGRTWSEERKRAASESKKGKTSEKRHAHITEIQEKCKQPIAMLDADLNVLGVFKSKTECANYFKCSITAIRTYTESPELKFWVAKQVYLQKITVEEYNNFYNINKLTEDKSE